LDVELALVAADFDVAALPDVPFGVAFLVAAFVAAFLTPAPDGVSFEGALSRPPARVG
jgi:hypothetical protein